MSQSIFSFPSLAHQTNSLNRHHTIFPTHSSSYPISSQKPIPEQNEGFIFSNQSSFSSNNWVLTSEILINTPLFRLYEEEADWFDFGDDDDDIIFEGFYPGTKQKFDFFPVPTEPVIPIERLTIALMDDHEFYCDDFDFIQIYTDGSFRSAPGGSFSAIGVWFGPNHKLNVSQPSRLGGFNSDGAELEAIIEAIKIACSCGVEKVQINTDSKNAVRFVTYFISKWEANGWRNIRGHPVRNQDLIQQLYEYTHLVTIKWNYVPSCGGVRGNVEADRLARNASAASRDKKRREDLITKRTSDQFCKSNRKMRRFKPY